MGRHLKRRRRPHLIRKVVGGRVVGAEEVPRREKGGKECRRRRRENSKESTSVHLHRSGLLLPQIPREQVLLPGEHKKSFDNMTYQRRTRKDISEAQKQAFDEAMADEGVCGKEVLAFHRDNPPEMRKKGLIDFSRFERIRGTRTSAKDSLGDVPMSL